MISSMEQCYDINRKFLMVVGLWPYQKWRFRIFQITLLPSVLISFLIVQLATFITSEFSLNIMLKVLSQACPCLIYFFTYICFLLKNKDIKILFEKMRYEWTTLKTIDEIDILTRYADIYKRFTITVTVTLILVMNSFALYQFFPDFLDIIVPLNESRERHFTFLAEYFIDQKQYFYSILIHSLLAIYIGGSAITSTGTMFMGFVFHICAMFEIASYRLEYISHNIPAVSEFKKDHIIRKRITNAVDVHRRAIEFTEFVLSNFANFFFALIGVGVSSLTINLFQLLQLLLYTNDTNGMLACGFLVTTHITYMFVGNFAGQLITDHNNIILNTTYNLQWYTVSLHTQKLLLFIMQRVTKNYVLIVGGVFAASLEGFATLMSMTVSYFTMIYSTR